MSKLKVNTIEIRKKENDSQRISTGSNTEVLLDGKPLRGCRKVSFEVSAGSVAKVTLEMYALVNIKATSTLKKGKLKASKLKDKNGKHLAVYTLSSPFLNKVLKKSK